jgi:hypothetical protein
MIIKAESVEPFLEWLKTCPVTYSISSMQGGFFHVKFMLPTLPPTPSEEPWK